MRKLWRLAHPGPFDFDVALTVHSNTPLVTVNVLVRSSMLGQQPILVGCHSGLIMTDKLAMIPLIRVQRHTVNGQPGLARWSRGGWTRG
jgi:hypothetical protein